MNQERKTCTSKVSLGDCDRQRPKLGKRMIESSKYANSTAPDTSHSCKWLSMENWRRHHLVQVETALLPAI